MATGVDKRRFDRFAARLKAKEVGPESHFNRLKKLVATEALTQVLLGFRESRNPYGVAWKPPLFRSGKPLLDTGRLRNSFTYTLTAQGFRIGTNVEYAPYHQYGGVFVAKKGSGFFRVPVPIQGPAPRGAGGSKRGIGTELRIVKSITMPRRQMIPEGTLGPIWTAAFQAVIDREAKRLLGR